MQARVGAIKKQTNLKIKATKSGNADQRKTFAGKREIIA